MAQGSGLLPSSIVQNALGFYTLSQKGNKERYFLLNPSAPYCWFSPSVHWFSSVTFQVFPISLLCFSKDTCFFYVVMAGPSLQAVEELIEETKNFCFDDFSIQVEPDNDVARDTVARTVVGQFFAKRGVSLGTLRRALSGMWRLSPGWRLQEPSPKIFVCRLNSPREAKSVLENGPWSPCGGFLLVTALPEDGDWRSANLESLDIWVKAFGVPMPFMTDACIANMASRMGSLIQSNKVRRNGIIANDFLRFQRHSEIGKIRLYCAGVGEANGGPIEVGSGSRSGAVIPSSPVAVTRVEQLGMEGVVTQNSKQAFSVAYNDYVDLSKFPTNHVLHVANIFKEKLGPIKFGAMRENEEEPRINPLPIQKLKKPKLVRPRGIPKPPMFGRNFDPNKLSGSKRKKSVGKSTRRSEFVAESQGGCCIQVVDKTGIPEVFGEVSGVNQSLGVSNGSEGEDSGKRHRIDMECLRSKEGSFGLNLENVCQPMDEFTPGSCTRSSEGFYSGFFYGRGGGSYHAPQRLMKLLSWNCRGLGNPRAKKALRNLIRDQDPDVLFLMETKLVHRRMDGVWRRLGFAGGVVVGSSGAAGGLCLCWKEGIEIEVVSSTPSTITARFSRVLNGPVWTCFCVYAPPYRGERVTFWENLSIEVAAVVEPWVVVGDLNLILDQAEKVGGSPPARSDCQIFRDFLDVSGGVDLGSVGGFYTWSNGRDFSHLIRERLDRVVGDSSWIVAYPKAGVRSLAIKDSDHAPIVLDLLLDRERFSTPFRFLDAWTRDPGCREVIRQAWEIEVRGFKSFQLVTRLAESRRRLAKWNREKFEEFNFALVTKLGWHLAAGTDSPWCQFFKDKYFRRLNSFWSVPKSKSWSFGAKSIMSTREFIRNETCFVVGNGASVDICHSPWLPGHNWESYVAAFNPRVCEKGVMVNSLVIPGRGDWNFEALESWFIPSMVKDVIAVPRLTMDANDELFWKSSPDGSFSVKKAYLACIRDRCLIEERMWSTLWKDKGHERIKIFLWRLARDILPFGSRIQRIFGNNSHCVLCNSGDDSPTHLFFHCDIAVQVWRSGPWGFRSDSMVFFDTLDMTKWLLKPYGTPLVDSDLALFSKYAISLCYILWRTRNTSFHEGVRPVVANIQQAISLLVEDWPNEETSVVIRHEEHNSSLGEFLREIPRSDVYVFVDAAVRGELGIAAVIVCDLSGQVLEAATVKRRVSSPFEAELAAIHLGCCRILQNSWPRVTILSDCKTAVQGLSSGQSPEWRVRGLFDDTFLLLSQMPNHHLCWIPRSWNSGAHSLAAWAASACCFRQFSSREVGTLAFRPLWF
ncbi:hypothetical protein F8388_023348 [Cannabis sativa]|uniref:Uncharacterized protein n=1 Tax=Cannabis sativa TaxID=3483 RepID=A0A7J6HE52_CANSA|nr:hypothetical protein F8388_023348 [Cannabis sativa]